MSIASAPPTWPAELTSRSEWVTWSREERDGKSTKVPYQVDGRKASTTNPQTWTRFHVVSDIPRTGNGGIGFVLTKSAGFVVIDLDYCRDPLTGLIESWALEIASRFGSFTEISPSGTGLHIWTKGTLPPGGRKRGQIEVYSEGRYMTCTGNRLGGTPNTIEERTDELAKWHAEVFGVPASAPPPQPISTQTTDLDDGALLEAALRSKHGDEFGRLWAGDTSAHGEDDSSADLALCNRLAFWTGRDAARMDRMFRASGLYRPKWDEPRGDRTYGQRTIDKAIEGCWDVYTPSQPVYTNGAHRNGYTAAVGPAPVAYNLTDLGNAERLIAQHGADIRYCHPWGKWFVWDGCRWKLDESGQLVRLAKATVRSMYAEAEKADDPKAVAKHAIRSEAESRITAMIALAASEVPISPDALDRDPWVLNVLNGTVDLTTGALRPHRREDYITKLAPVIYDPDAPCPTWDAFLEGILPDFSVRAYLKKFAGYSATGDTREQILAFAYGGGANGKSTCLKTIQAALGDYGRQAAPDLLLERGDDSHPTKLADLFGARLVISVEVQEGKRLAESLVKQMTGGDRLKARRMRCDYFEFEATHKIIVAANHKPVIRGTDDAIWRRIRLIPFTVTIPESEQDKALGDKLRAELPGVLRWIVEGCLAWQIDGLRPPKAVREATNGYRAEMDVIGAFLGDCCELSPLVAVSKADLYAGYVKWCEANGERPMTQRSFGTHMAERADVEDAKSMGTRMWRGIRLLTTGTVGTQQP